MMRALKLLTCVISVATWALALTWGLTELNFIACVMLPDGSITSQFLHRVALPSAMLSLASYSLALILFQKDPGKPVTYMVVGSILAAVVYYLSMTGLAVSEPTLSRCLP